jgi:hypothetical protein
MAISDEVRVFPLITLSGEISPYLHPILSTLNESQSPVLARIERVSYEFQKGANSMLVVTKKHKH